MIPSPLPKLCPAEWPRSAGQLNLQALPSVADDDESGVRPCVRAALPIERSQCRTGPEGDVHRSLDGPPAVPRDRTVLVLLYETGGAGVIGCRCLPPE